MGDGAEARLAVVEMRQKLHEDHCDERSERTAADISAINSRMEREATERSEGLRRVHARIEKVEQTATATKAAVDNLPHLIADKIAGAQQQGKLWLYGRVAAWGGGALSVATLLWEIFGKHI